MEHLKMLRLLSYLLGLFIFPSVQGGNEFHSKDESLCVLKDAPQQCGSFCLAALNPIFDDTDSMRMTLDEIKAGQSALNARMTTLQGQEDLQAGLDSRFKLAEEQHMAVNSEMKNQLQELGRRVSRTTTKTEFANSIKALQTKLDARLNRMEELMKMKITANANDELKTQVNSLKDTIKDLQSQLKISEGQIKSKEDILKVKEEDLKNRDEQISTLTTQIKAIEKTKSELSIQFSELHKYYDILSDSCPNGSPNGIYQIKLPSLEPFEVPCATSPRGWTVIQRRIDGSENFERNWHDYKSGFGNVRGEFFIGLEKLHRMTEARPHELYIKLGMVDGSTSYAQYDDFKIGSEEEGYELKNLGKYSGEAGDSLTENEHQKFSTFDRDNTINAFNCASRYGAWWHNACSFSSLNGEYFKDGKGYYGILWYSWHKDWSESLTFVEVMIRPKSL
ncbi:fibrinogen-like protein 1 [Drosophila rhopaloa]|uniref:Fibrinogen-like protein 1 n=1 Tax=Drosophila rhopaloa TaxID=1041015 RepID=A0A6P4F6X4_DRORH|nr:fibrinogen-like protein 1 [Drosophila rhopaloa]